MIGARSRASLVQYLEYQQQERLEIVFNRYGIETLEFVAGWNVLLPRETLERQAAVSVPAVRAAPSARRLNGKSSLNGKIGIDREGTNRDQSRGDAG